MRLLADENLDNDIVRAILRQGPSLDIPRVQDVGLTGADDPTVLAWAAAEGRVLVTHDVNTIPRYAYERLGRGERMPGEIIIAQQASIARCIEDLLLLAECSEDHSDSRESTDRDEANCARSIRAPTARCSARSGSRSVSALCTRRRARLAS